MKLCHLCTDVCRKTRKAGTSDPSDAQQRTCLAIRSITDLLMIARADLPRLRGCQQRHAGWRPSRGRYR